MAPKRQIKQTPTLEYVEFVPYGKRTLPVQKDVFDYVKICREYLPQVLNTLSPSYTDATSKGHEVNKLRNTSQNTMLASYLEDDNCGFIKVLNEIGKIKTF